jgi:hypothetical protein
MRKPRIIGALLVFMFKADTSSLGLDQQPHFGLAITNCITPQLTVSTQSSIPLGKICDFFY